MRKKYEEDKEKVLSYYNSLGFRDAQIVDTIPNTIIKRKSEC